MQTASQVIGALLLLGLPLLAASLGTFSLHQKIKPKLGHWAYPVSAVSLILMFIGIQFGIFVGMIVLGIFNR